MISMSMKTWTSLLRTARNMESLAGLGSMLIFTYLRSFWYKYNLKSLGRICISKGSKGIGW